MEWINRSFEYHVWLLECLGQHLNFFNACSDQPCTCRGHGAMGISSAFGCRMKTWGRIAVHSKKSSAELCLIFTASMGVYLWGWFVSKTTHIGRERIAFSSATWFFWWHFAASAFVFATIWGLDIVSRRRMSNLESVWKNPLFLKFVFPRCQRFKSRSWRLRSGLLTAGCFDMPACVWYTRTSYWNHGHNVSSKWPWRTGTQKTQDPQGSSNCCKTRWSRWLETVGFGCGAAPQRVTHFVCH